ncbi:phenylacetic acid degradation protein [Methanofollis fontis]|uniref:Phenylacetic acid degradation protein n=2 Tax=Methanofollis fontis TaxID=2052832 RepID=A0A483CS16_9EURY|nr:phenylacetic acid degradation protein [Methanofollis fontis]
MGYLEDLGERGGAANPFFVLMGIEPVSFGDGRAELSMPVRPDMLNGAGWLQGGLYTALADEAMALALLTVLGEGERIATISQTTQYLSGVREGCLKGTARVVRKGRTIAFTDGEIRGSDGALCARTTASFAVMARQG